MPTRYVTSTDGPVLSVNQMIKDPLYIPTRIISITEQLFVADKLLRSAGSAPGGAFQYFVSSPLFAGGDAEIVNEFGEIPAVPADVGDPVVGRTRRRALALLISEQMRTRNSRDLVQKQIIQIRNSLIRSVDGAFMSALTNAAPNTRAAGAVWASNSSTIRKDINGAKQQIVDQQRGYEPDTLLIHPSRATELLDSPEFIAPYRDTWAAQNPQITGQLPGTILGLTPLLSYQASPTEAWVLEAKTIGGIVDERPLRATEMYEHKPTESWRTDVSRVSEGFIDEPKAATKITGTA